MNMSKQVEEIVAGMEALAAMKKHKIMTPEHLLYALLGDRDFLRAFRNCGGNPDALRNDLEECLEGLGSDAGAESAVMSPQLERLFQAASARAIACDKETVEIPHLVSALPMLEESPCLRFIEKQEITVLDLLYELCELIEADAYPFGNVEVSDDVDFLFSMEDFASEKSWEEYVVCMNDHAEEYDPLIGREVELERTLQVLCRRSKNNPLHVGEAGVGKTAITRGLVRRLVDGNVPQQLKDAKVFALDMGALLAGTQYRGDFEKRFRKVMEGVASVEKPIVYMDEIHNIVGLGAVSGGSMDLSNLLKAYLAEGRIRFIGATTYEEYKRYFVRNQSLTRRFQNIEVREPSVPEAIAILNGVKGSYEKYHGVKYGKGVIEHAVRLSDRFVNERFLPDKAIDLIDEAGAYRSLHPLARKQQSVDKDLIEEILSKTCRIPRQTLEAEEAERLEGLEEAIRQDVFGQDEAVRQVVNAIKLSRCGLNEDGRTIANLLFVGPTGVGKTEIARSLARNLGVSLVRFDMSEYGEKQSVAKLIGAPAGYVGYEEGGLLTDAIRKTPHCVLLLDEIEKAHPDVFHVLLQLMDYATLTDNQGKKADFRNVIVIMTSNAGARWIGKAQMGFESSQRNVSVMEEELERIFSPEFRNRLTKVIPFGFVDEAMAQKIIDKQLGLLLDKLANKNVKVTVDESVREYLRRKGVSNEYGARHVARLIQTEIKPTFVDLLLFGALRKGGECRLVYEKGRFCCRVAHRSRRREKASV